MKKIVYKVLILSISIPLLFLLPDLTRHLTVFNNHKITIPTELTYARSIYTNGVLTYDKDTILSNQMQIRELIKRISAGKYRMMGYHIFKNDVSDPKISLLIRYSDHNILFEIDVSGNVKFFWHGHYYGGRISIESYNEFKRILYHDK